MNLTLERRWFTPDSAQGELYLDGVFECFTLEDTERPESAEKVDGQTAIPLGRYRVVIDFSRRFQRPMPHLLDVPGFEGIRIHPGNTVADTSGCILVGRLRAPGAVLNPRPAFGALFDKLREADRAGQTMWLEIRRGPVEDVA